MMLQTADNPSGDEHQATREYSITDLTELFSVSRPTVYRTLQRHPDEQAR